MGRRLVHREGDGDQLDAVLVLGLVLYGMSARDLSTSPDCVLDVMVLGR